MLRARPSGRLLSSIAAGVAAGLGIAWCILGTVPFVGAAAPSARLREVTYYAALRDDVAHGTLDQRSQLILGEGGGVDSSGRRDFVVSPQREFQGTVDRDAVEALVAAGNADALMSHLAPAARVDLLRSLRSIDTTLSEVAKLALLEVGYTKEQLLQRPDRLIEITTHPREQDRNYPMLLEARRDIESRQKGAVWGDIIDQREVHFIVRWDEWPLLEALYEEQRHWAVERQLYIRSWIERQFAKRGMALFSKT